MQKITVLYGHPKDEVGKMKGIAKAELTKIIGTPDGKKADYYRMAGLYFTDAEQMQQAMASAEGMATVADLSNFATGGVTVMVGTTDA